MKVKRFALSLSTICLTILMSCGGQEGENDSTSTESSESGGYALGDLIAQSTKDYEEYGEYEEDYQDQTLISDVEIEDRKLIKTAYLSFEVDDIVQTTAKIHSAIDKHRAYIFSEEEYNSYDRENATIEIRIPSKNFEGFLTDVSSGVEYFESKDISATDVTEEFIDVEARIKTKKEVEQQYIALLEKAISIADIMEIEQHIGRVREEIESAEGRLRYLKNSTSYSTVTLNYYKVLKAPSKFSQEFSGSFNQGWVGFVSVLIVLTALWPFLAIGLIVFVAIRIYRKRLKNKI